MTDKVQVSPVSQSMTAGRWAILVAAFSKQSCAKFIANPVVALVPR
jgi:hypothetical protein